MKKIVEKTQDHWLEIEDEDGWSSAQVKWDGCIHYSQYFNNPIHDKKRNPQDTDTLHICDIDAFIKELQEIKRLAQEHFGSEWPK